MLPPGLETHLKLRQLDTSSQTIVILIKSERIFYAYIFTYALSVTGVFIYEKCVYVCVHVRVHVFLCVSIYISRQNISSEFATR